MIEGALRAAQPRSKHPIHEDVLPPADAFPGYEIVREIHRGGQGIVYQAVQKTTKRKVAIKVLHLGPFGGSKGRARFEREVAILAQLEHPNIVSILDSGITSESAGKQCFYVMDYVSGQTLDALLAGSASRPVPDTLSMFLKICDAVNAAHLKGITHRDLKPSNIRVDHNGEPHVLDFGLAKIVTGETVQDAQHVQMMSMTGQFIGSLPWASPEQAEGAPAKIDIRSDVYSLGVILYQLLTGGKFPYQVIGNMRDVMENILRAEPARPSTVRKQINDEVETIVLKTLQKERERRYQSAGELAKDIRRYLSGEPIEAMRESGWYLVRKTVRRHKVLCGSLAAALVVVLAFGAYAYWNGKQLKRLADDKEAAVTQREQALQDKIKAEEAASVMRRLYDVRTAAGRDLIRKGLIESSELIRNLVGATATRELLLANSAAYLETLRDQLKDDADYLTDLAQAHELTGDLRAGLYLPRIRKDGVTQQGAANYAEAARLRLELLGKDPGSPGRLEAAARAIRKRADSKLVSAAYADAAADLRQSLAYFDQAIANAAASGLAAGDRTRLEDGRAGAILAIGDVLFIQARRESDAGKSAELSGEAQRNYDAAEAYWRARLVATPGDQTAARSLGVVLDKNAAARVEFGRAHKANAERLIKAGQLDEAAAKAGLAIGYFDEAQRLASAALETFSGLLAANRSNAVLKRDEYLAHHNLGMALMYKAQTNAALAKADARFGDRAREAESQHTAALAAFSAARDITDRLASADEDNIEAQRDLAICLNKVGNEQRDLGDLAHARETFTRSLGIRRELFRTDPTQQQRRDLAVALYKVGELDAIENNWASAAKLFDEAVTHFEQLLKDEVIRPEDGTLAEMRSARDTARRNLGS
ncbi:MAG: protein kinase [Phycisphaerales bacterium]